MLIDKKIFFDEYRQHLDVDGKLTQTEVYSLDFFLDMTNKNIKYFTTEQWAYVYATVFHETAHTFAPVKEAFNRSEEWRKLNLRYYPYYGRGYVQLTWRVNYERYTKILKEDLKVTINKRDDFMIPNIAFFVLRHGMKHGNFTGRSIDEFINSDSDVTNPTDRSFRNARTVINGRDRADVIADHAKEFYRILTKSIK